MRTTGQQSDRSKRTLYGWRDVNGKYCLSAMFEPAKVHGAPHRPYKMFTTKQAAEDEAAVRNSTIEWNS